MQAASHMLTPGGALMHFSAPHAAHLAMKKTARQTVGSDSFGMNLPINDISVCGGKQGEKRQVAQKKLDGKPVRLCASERIYP
jgi:hypothetical protein